MAGDDWYKDKSGNYVHDSNVTSSSKLCDGCTYLGKTYNIATTDGNDVQLNADGSSTQGDTTSYGMEVDYNWKSGNKVYAGVGGSDNSRNAYLNAMNSTTGSQNDFGDFSRKEQIINKGMGLVSSLAEGFQVLGFVGYGFGVYVKELEIEEVTFGHNEGKESLKKNIPIVVGTNRVPDRSLSYQKEIEEALNGEKNSDK